MGGKALPLRFVLLSGRKHFPQLNRSGTGTNVTRCCPRHQACPHQPAHFLYFYIPLFLCGEGLLSTSLTTPCRIRARGVTLGVRPGSWLAVWHSEGTPVPGSCREGPSESMEPYLRVVHVPQQAVGLGVQDEIPPQKLAAGLIFLDVQEPADTVLSVQVRHAGLLLASPCRGTGQGRGGCSAHAPLPTSVSFNPSWVRAQPPARSTKMPKGRGKRESAGTDPHGCAGCPLSEE